MEQRHRGTRGRSWRALEHQKTPMRCIKLLEQRQGGAWNMDGNLGSCCESVGIFETEISSFTNLFKVGLYGLEPPHLWKSVSSLVAESNTEALEKCCLVIVLNDLTQLISQLCSSIIFLDHYTYPYPHYHHVNFWGFYWDSKIIGQKTVWKPNQ